MSSWSDSGLARYPRPGSWRWLAILLIVAGCVAALVADGIGR